MTDFERAAVEMASGNEEHGGGAHDEDCDTCCLLAIIERLQSPRAVCTEFERLARERKVRGIELFYASDGVGGDVIVETDEPIEKTQLHSYEGEPEPQCSLADAMEVLAHEALAAGKDGG